MTDRRDGWKEAFVPWAVLNPQGLPFDRIAIQANRQVGSDWVLIDHVALTKPGAGGEARATPVRRPSWSSTAASKRRRSARSSTASRKASGRPEKPHIASAATRCRA